MVDFKPRPDAPIDAPVVALFLHVLVERLVKCHATHRPSKEYDFPTAELLRYIAGIAGIQHACLKPLKKKNTTTTTTKRMNVCILDLKF